jgi:hypothetical protein
MSNPYTKPKLVKPAPVMGMKKLPSTDTRQPTPSPHNQNPSQGWVTETNGDTGGN